MDDLGALANFCPHTGSVCTFEVAGPTFSKLLRKILERLLILGQSLTKSGNALTRHNFSLVTN